VFLTPEEHARRYRAALRRYRRFLASSLLRRRDRSFWDYHRHTSSTLGLPLSALSLTTALLSLAADHAGRPARRLLRALAAFRRPTASV
jgi:hypothetical protein